MNNRFLPPIPNQIHNPRIPSGTNSPEPQEGTIRVKVNPYQLFRLNETEPLNERILRNKYRELLLVCHPDKPTGSVKKFKILQQSYSFLVSKLDEQLKTTKAVTSQTVNKEVERRLDASETIPKNNYLRFQKGEKFAAKEFNDFFEENRPETGHDAGYGDWLKSTDTAEKDMTERVEKVKEGQFMELFERERAKILQTRSVVKYQESIAAQYSAPSVGATDLDELAAPSSFTTKLSRGGGIMGTDLKEALEIGIIDVGMPENTRERKTENTLEEMKKVRENIRYHMSPEEQARLDFETQKQKQYELERETRLKTLEQKREQHFRKVNFLLGDNS
jgi:hypothetical protein